MNSPPQIGQSSTPRLSSSVATRGLDSGAGIEAGAEADTPPRLALFGGGPDSLSGFKVTGGICLEVIGVVVILLLLLLTDPPQYLLAAVWLECSLNF